MEEIESDWLEDKFAFCLGIYKCIYIVFHLCINASLLNWLCKISAFGKGLYNNFAISKVFEHEKKVAKKLHGIRITYKIYF